MTELSQKLARIAVIGGGPAGLSAAEAAAEAGARVTLYEAMPTVGRKFLMAGKSGLNITHSEDLPQFLLRYTPQAPTLEKALKAFDNEAVVRWMEGLGEESFVGSSGRIFPKSMKGSPLLRAWLKRLEGLGVEIKTRHRWQGFEDDTLKFEAPEGERLAEADATILALGGASWPRLGSDAAWTRFLEERGVDLAPFRPANCGFDVGWSEHFIERFAGEPVKAVVATSRAGSIAGEFVVTKTGVEGSLIYAHASSLVRALEDGAASLTLDLAPNRTLQQLTKGLAKQNPKHSLSNRLRKGAGLSGVKVGLLRELAGERLGEVESLAKAIKTLPLPVISPRPMAEAISTSGGVTWSELDDQSMVTKIPGLFVAGEMVDWDAPTGGYLLTACMATGRLAGESAAAWLSAQVRR